MARVFSGIQPTGVMHLGNYLGAVRTWANQLDDRDVVLSIVDLHALTIPKPADELRSNTIGLAAALIASGVDPERCTLFVQSHVPAHAELGWLMQCTASFGELSRMVQFKDKRERAEFVSGGLFAYPALQAADILAYDADEVPIGEDQRQHLELARDVAERFNARYGPTFVVPKAVLGAAGARVMDLSRPDKKMAKSSTSDAGVVWLDDSPDVIAKKFKRAVTDSDGVVRYDREAKPGVSNLLSILAAFSGGTPEDAAAGYTQYGPLKNDAAEATIAALGPIRERLVELEADPAELERLLRIGAEKATAIAEPVRARAFEAMGLLPR